MKQEHETNPSWQVRLLTTCIGIVAVFLIPGCGSQTQAPPQPPPGVTVIEAVRRDVPVIFEYIAQTQSSHLVNIQARVSGFLEKRMYTEGAVVKKGQVLFLMDTKPFQVQLDQARAALARQQAALETARL